MPPPNAPGAFFYAIFGGHVAVLEPPGVTPAGKVFLGRPATVRRQSGWECWLKSWQSYCLNSSPMSSSILVNLLYKGYILLSI